MNDKLQMIPLAGLLSTVAISAYMVVQLNAQPLQTGDFTNAATAEVRDAQGVVVLRGLFAQVEEEDDDIERRAALAPTGTYADAVGEAEVEYSTASPVVQEVELSMQKLPPDTTFTFVIDAVEVATVRTDRRGRVELELDVRMPGAAH